MSERLAEMILGILFAVCFGAAIFLISTVEPTVTNCLAVIGIEFVMVWVWLMVGDNLLKK